MIDTLIIHGSFSSPLENWFPWLARQLAEQGRRVLAPHFPDRESQRLDLWESVLDGYAGCLSPDSLMLYAHSLAPAFVVDYFVRRNRKIKKAIFVAPFYGRIGIPEFDRVNETFFVDENYLARFVGLREESICIFSNNDPYVPQSMSEDFTRRTGSTHRMVPGGKHLNESAGFSQFPLLLEV